WHRSSVAPDGPRSSRDAAGDEGLAEIREHEPPLASSGSAGEEPKGLGAGSPPAALECSRIFRGSQDGSRFPWLQLFETFCASVTSSPEQPLPARFGGRPAPAPPCFPSTRPARRLPPRPQSGSCAAPCDRSASAGWSGPATEPPLPR